MVDKIIIKSNSTNDFLIVKKFNLKKVQSIKENSKL